MTQGENVEKTEEWFLEQLEAEQPDIKALNAWLLGVWEDGRHGAADSSMDLLLDSLVERADELRKQQKTDDVRPLIDGAFILLTTKAAWHDREKEFRDDIHNQALRVLGSSSETRPLVDNVGFQDGSFLTECIRRLNVLRQLAPGILCYDKTWGCGEVLSVDWFYKRVDIDFEKKKGHQMSFGYAGETLEIIGEDHLLYALTRRREELMAMVEENPAEVVRMALRSFGPLPIAIVQEHLIPRILAETQWKGFWDSARKVLKKDPLVVIPTRRSEPLCLLASEKAYDDAWFAQLKKERTMERILELVEEYQSEGTDKPDEAQAKIMANRLAFVVKGAGRRQPGLAARAVMLAKEFELPADQLDADAYIRSLLEVGTFLPVVSDIPARDIGRLLQHMKKVESDTCLNMLGENLTAFDISLLNEAMDLLLQEGREDICRAVFRDHTVEQESADVEMLYWLYRNPQWLDSWSLGSVSNLARWMLRALEYDHNGEKLKTQNQLRKGFEQEDWLRDVLAVMTAPERRDLFRRIKESTRWETLDRQSLMGRIIKWYPEMQEVLKASIEEEAVPVQQAGRVTSERSYRERQEQMQRIIQEEIPAVAREIAKAREYGDLSENFEYTAAKDKQALLLKRQAELQEMLASVRPVDFAGFSAEAVGMGTEVVLVHAAGQRETYCILGVWDRDEALGIISCESALAKALEGHRAGDEVVVPTEHGEATCLVERVSRVPEEVQNWIVG